MIRNCKNKTLKVAKSTDYGFRNNRSRPKACGRGSNCQSSRLYNVNGPVMAENQYRMLS